MAVAGMVLGILAIVLCWVMFANFVLGVLGIVFGAIGLGRAKTRGGAGKGMALAGVITGIIGIVVSIAFVMLVFTAVKMVDKEMHRAKDRVVKMQTEQLANEAYPQWAMVHAGKVCPDSVAELREYMSGGVTDPWGHDYKILCGKSLPPGVKGLAALSFGPDGVEGTDDDIKSWEP